MNGRFSQAVRLVLSDCTDPSREGDFNDWYTRVHVRDMLGSGLVSGATRYRNADPRPGEAVYLAIYELDRVDVEAAGEEIATFARRLEEQGRLHPALRPVSRIMGRRIGPEFRAPGAARPAGGIFIVQSHCTVPAREEEFNRWYDLIHIPDLLNMGLFHTAYRFEAAPPAGAGGRYLAIYETEGDPMEAVQEFSREHRPRLKEAGRLTELIEVTWRGIFRRILA